MLLPSVALSCSPGAGPAGGTSGSPTASVLPAVPSTRPAPAGSAAAALATLPVKGRAPLTGYSRRLFGPAWSDDATNVPDAHNGCDTRNDILNRDLTDKTWRSGTDDCVVISGTLHDPYTGRVITFAKAHATAVQIDHVVALADAWQKGAQSWSAAQRLSFANDPLELLAVDGPTNQRKGDADAATWLPPNKSYRCAYVARQVSVKVKYHLWVTAAEGAAMQRVLSGCPAQPLVVE